MVISNYNFKNRVDLERVILGGLLIWEKNHIKGKELFFSHGLDRKEYFTTDFHQDVYQCILDCWKNNISADIVTVSNFRDNKYRGLEAIPFDAPLIGLTQAISSNAHLEYHLFIHKQYLYIDFWNNKAVDILDGDWEQRDVVEVSENIINSFKFFEEKLTSGLPKNEDVQDSRVDIMNQWQNAQNGVPVSVPIGLYSIDEFTGGWYNKEFYIVAGRPGMGKTTVTFLLVQKSALEFNIPGAFFTLEMPKKQLQNKIIADELGIKKEDIRKFNLDYQTMCKVVERYNWMDNESPLKIYDDCRSLSSIRKRIQETKPKFVVVDYLQLIEMDEGGNRKVGNRENEVSAISRTLKSMAMEFDIPVIALSQLSRGVDSRQIPRPFLSDLRESGSLEQDADMVIFYFRPAYYQEIKKIPVEEHEKGNLEFIIAKGRETGTGDFQIHVDFKINKLYDYWFHHNNKDEFYENRNPKQYQEIPKPPEVVPLPPKQ